MNKKKNFGGGFETPFTGRLQCVIVKMQFSYIG